ncbi:MAG: membrane-bound lytic murein transglycosylase D [Arenicella sp.]|jgi:membrane-bound lytic murein transglycosylase D
MVARRTTRGDDGLTMTCQFRGLARGFVYTAFLLLCISHVASAAPTLSRPVANYALQCDETFSCPESLLPRVGFWIEVFSRWDTGTAIFHDKDNPHRVYSTLQRQEGCRNSREGDSISQERKRLKRNLSALANKLSNGGALTESQSRLYASFKGAPAKEVEAASNRVRCQSGNKDRMREALAQFHIYRPTILDALESQNLTPELQYLPFVESAFNPEALSHVGAAGLWQIMPSTGRGLGLTVDSKVDQRYDPRAATYAAAKYFRNSVDTLSEAAFESGDTINAKDLNPFVITSYNYGVGGMLRAIKQVGLDYERLLLEYKSPSFQTAVKNFYASFLAARHVAKNSEKFFGVVAPDDSRRFASFNTLVLTRATSVKRISKELGIDIDDLKGLNPALKRIIWRHKALVPKGYSMKLPYTEQGWELAASAMNQLPREIEKAGFVVHKVRRGQTACGIAERYKASCSSLRALNKLNQAAVIYVGQRLKVPTESGGIRVAKSSIGVAGNAGTSSITADNNASSSASVTANISSSLQSYKVLSGDTSCSIAQRSGMRCGEFLAINGLRRSSVIQIGQLVKVSSANSWHVVRSGQSACGIAASYRVQCSLLLDANLLTRVSNIQIGQRLRIPSQRY